MGFSLSHGKTLDVGHIGILQDQLPPMPAPGQGPSRVDLKAWFGPARAQLPLELEIGSGKGTFLLNQAKKTPEVNYVGIEWAMQYWKYAADRCRRHGMENVRLLRTEAGAFVRDRLADACLRQMHIYFPDPWPKARHNKRRLVQVPFLRQAHRVLEPHGLLRIATDHSDYFAWMVDHANQVAELFDSLPFESPESAGEGELVGTNFERKYRREGRPFHGMILRKR